jgi:hypothetical protein
MIFIENIINTNINILKNFSVCLDKQITTNSLTNEIILYIKFSTAVINITLFLLIILTILNFLYNFFFKNISYLLQLLRFINLSFITLILVLLIIKFYFSLKLEQSLGPYIYDIKYNFFKENSNVSYFEYFIVFSSSFSDAILILSFITGLICLELLGYKNLLKSVNNITLFYTFNFLVVIMVNTCNMLIMFISFEFIFLPTMYFVYKLGYSKKVDKSNVILFY